MNALSVDANEAVEPRPRGRDAVRAAVLGSAIRLFADKGPSSVSLRDIAADAKVNLGLLHRHFGSKQELVTAAIEHYLDGVRSRMWDALQAKDLAEAMVHVFRHDVTLYTRLNAWSLLDGVEPSKLQQEYPGVTTLVGYLESIGFDAVAARARAAAIFGICAGFGFFEPTLRVAADLDTVPDDVITSTLAASVRVLLDPEA
jgi:AcrR family transcriptional regulator